MAAPRKSYTLWIVGRILSGLVGLIIFAMVAFLIWRVYFSDHLPDGMETLSTNAELAAAYAEAGDSLQLYTQKQGTMTREEHNYGYFGVPRFVYIPQAEQLQVVFRYNNSTLEAIRTDFALDEEPPRGVEIFDITLIMRHDLTPDDTSDNTDDSENIGDERLYPTSVSVDTTSLYTYFLYTFDGVTFPEDLIVAYLDVYFGDTPDYSVKSLGSLRLYHRDDPWLEVDFTRADKKALEAYLEQ